MAEKKYGPVNRLLRCRREEVRVAIKEGTSGHRFFSFRLKLKEFDDALRGANERIFFWRERDVVGRECGRFMQAQIEYFITLRCVFSLPDKKDAGPRGIGAEFSVDGDSRVFTEIN